MARFNYAGLTKLVDKNLRRFGLKTGKAFLERASVRREVVAVEANFSPRERDGQLVQMSDVRFLVSSYGETTPPDQELDAFIWIHPDTTAEIKYRLVAKPQRTAPGGENVFWQLHCREK